MLTIVQNSTEADFEDFGVYKPPWLYSAHLRRFKDVMFTDRKHATYAHKHYQEPNLFGKLITYVFFLL